MDKKTETEIAERGGKQWLEILKKYEGKTIDELVELYNDLCDLYPFVASTPKRKDRTNLNVVAILVNSEDLSNVTLYPNREEFIEEIEFAIDSGWTD